MSTHHLHSQHPQQPLPIPFSLSSMISQVHHQVQTCQMWRSYRQLLIIHRKHLLYMCQFHPGQWHIHSQGVLRQSLAATNLNAADIPVWPRLGQHLAHIDTLGPRAEEHPPWLTFLFHLKVPDPIPLLHTKKEDLKTTPPDQWKNNVYRLSRYYKHYIALYLTDYSIYQSWMTLRILSAIFEISFHLIWN